MDTKVMKARSYEQRGREGVVVGTMMIGDRRRRGGEGGTMTSSTTEDPLHDGGKMISMITMTLHPDGEAEGDL